MEENRTVETTATNTQTTVQEGGSGGGKIIGVVAIIISVIALVLALSNLGVKREVKEVKKIAGYLSAKEQSLEVKALKLEALSTLERVYALTMVERNYDAAKSELEKAKGLIDQLKPYMTDSEANKVEKLFGALKAEVERGPSPIPVLVANLSNTLSKVQAKVSVSKVAVPKVEKAEAEATKKEEKKVEIKKAPKVAKPAVTAEKTEESSLKKTYLFWKKLGESLVKK